MKSGGKKMKGTSAKFLILSVKDRELNKAIIDIRKETKLSAPRKNCHITLRGPYKTAPSKNIVEKVKAEVLNDTIVISGVRITKNACVSEDYYIVYLPVYSSQIDKFIYKPDFNFVFPHITVYAGTNYSIALDVYEACKKRNIWFRIKPKSCTLKISTKRYFYAAALISNDTTMTESIKKIYTVVYSRKHSLTTRRKFVGEFVREQNLFVKAGITSHFYLFDQIDKSFLKALYFKKELLTKQRVPKAIKSLIELNVGRILLQNRARFKKVGIILQAA
jgi:hypothetical protein